MGVEWNRGTDEPPPMIADRHLYLDKEQATIVEEGDERSAYQFIGKGRVIEQADIDRLGLVLEDGRVVQRRGAASEEPSPEPEAGEPEAETPAAAEEPSEE